MSTRGKASGDFKNEHHRTFGSLVICKNCGVFEMMPQEELNGVVRVLMELPDKTIDAFFYDCGMLFENERRRIGMKALTPLILKDIRKNKEYSTSFVLLRTEHSRSAIMNALNKAIGFKPGRT